MSDSTGYLSEEERVFLRELFENTDKALENDEATGVIQLEALGLDRERLLAVLKNMKTEVIATDGTHRLRFQLETDGVDGKQGLRLVLPKVIDQRGRERDVRVWPGPGEVRVHDPALTVRDAHVLDVSTSGLRMSCRTDRSITIGDRIENIVLELPVSAPVTFSATVVRIQFEDETQDRQQLALRFDRLDHPAEAALRRYIFERF
ncbi:hypothetical protein CAI21_17705 [Alkalilimnicola ehrlichii]|uniref:PilZ domain-containing protein n=1 Tax=Alkalilimnicola ehrlichii TaxID=351052 RepID=UPI000E2E9EF3|nr:PilZ domain-containing protein [Alkalilimnicola ehrlichii]RFA26165.1 hypothetical protein CAI21_17705 [Alkalilimnicola ehrlichii]